MFLGLGPAGLSAHVVGSVLSLRSCSSLGFCVVMLDVLGHGVWALAVGGAASSWEELLGASLAELRVCASLAYVIDGMSASPPLVRGDP